MDNDFSINAPGGPTAATQEFAGEGEEKKDVIETEAAGGGEEIGGSNVGDGDDGGSVDNSNTGAGDDGDLGNQDDSDAVVDPADVKLSDDTLVPHDQEGTTDEEEQKAVKEIDPEELDRALREALDCQCPLDVNASLLVFEAGDRVELRHRTNIITIDVIAIDNDDCVGLNQSDSDWMTNMAHIPCGCYVKFKKQNVVNVV